MKCCITGHTRGIGLAFYDHFKSKGWDVVGINPVNFNTIDSIIEQSKGCDIFINNAYADGRQIDLVEALHDKVGKMIVCGSVAAVHPDPDRAIYSLHKRQLLQLVQKLANPNIFMLHLSAKGYNDTAALLAVIDLWLKHPHITEVGFDPTGEPNGQ